MKKETLEARIQKAEARIQKLEGTVEMYQKRIEKKCAECMNLGIELSEADFTVTMDHNWAHAELTDKGRGIEWQITYPIENAIEGKHNTLYKINSEKKGIEALEKEIEKIDQMEYFNELMQESFLVTALREQMKGFKADWIAKMERWHEKHYDYIHENQDAALAWSKKYSRLERKYWFVFNGRDLSRFIKKLNNKQKAMVEITRDEAAFIDKAAYMAQMKSLLLDQFEKCIITLAERCQKFGVDENKVSVIGYDVTEKGFEAVLRDDKARRIYARIIWAAEYSDVVSPHVRYIVTEKREAA